MRNCQEIRSHGALVYMDQVMGLVQLRRKKSKCKISNLHDVNKQVVEETTERHPPGILNTVKKEKGLGQNSEEHQHVRYG